MKLKGHSIIELTDAKTGEVERFEDDNIVTNGLKYYLAPCLGVQRLYYYSVIYEEFFSGIKLMEEQLKESTETIYVPTDINIVGYAGLEADSSNPKRGLFNRAESGVLEDGSGIRLVWDFSQSQANGTIACIGITPNICVRVIYENIEAFLITSKSINKPQSNWLDYVKKERMMYTYQLETSKNLEIGKMELPIWEYGITNQGIKKRDEIISVTLDGASECVSLNYINKDSEYYYFFGFIKCDTAEEPYKNYFNLYKIKKLTFEVQKIDIVFSEAAYPELCFGSSWCRYSFVRGNYIYIYSVKSPGSYFKVDLTDSSFVKCIPTIDDTGTPLDCSTMTLRGDDAISRNYSIDKKDVFHSDRIGGNGGYGSFFMEQGYYIKDNYSSFDVSHVPFLFTVNNLASPVVKTADKSMKITYILREVLE